MTIGNVVSFILGAGVGVGGTIYFVRKHYKEEAEKDINEMREYLRSKGVSDEAQKRYSTPPDEEIDESDEPRTTMNEALEFRKKREGAPKVDYTKFKDHPIDPEEFESVAAQYAAEDLVDEDEARLAEAEHPKDSDEDDAIRIISEREYLETHVTDYGKLDWIYYSEDNSLCDENEELVPDVNAFIGPYALHSFGEDNDDPDIVYIRNNKLGNDYCVTRLHASYSEAVLGIIPGLNDNLEARRRMMDD